jgi:hypothetical protein
MLHLLLKQPKPGSNGMDRLIAQSGAAGSLRSATFVNRERA